MKNFIKLISIFTLVFLSSMPIYAAEFTSLSMEDLDTVIYEELLTEFYSVEEGYAYCSAAVNITSNSALNDSITVSIPDAVSIPEDITLTPKYVAGSAAPVWYASFDIVVTGEFDNGSYGSYEKLASFTIKSEDGETRTVTTNIENTTINQNGTTTFSVEIMSPNPTLLKDFTGELKLNTTLHEVIPFAA